MILISLLPAANSRNFESFEAFWAFLRILQVLVIGVVSPRARPLVGTAQNGENSTFLEMSCKNYTCLYMGSNFFGDLGLQKLKIHQNFDFLPTF